MAETVGLEGRVSFYDGAGALRDMVQNHMLQLLALVAMEPPANYDATAIRDEKVKVLRALRLIGPDETVTGQYRAGAIGGQPVPYCLARIPQAGETRGNLAAGGTGVARELTARDREIAEALAPRLHAQGLLLVGLDVIGDYLTEINVTSPTCFQEITKQTGFNVAGMMIDALEALP